jgi:hypothetical protein
MDWTWSPDMPPYLRIIVQYSYDSFWPNVRHNAISE